MSILPSPPNAGTAASAGEHVRFIILGRYRSGSTLVARTLAQHPAVAVHEELFNVRSLARRQDLLADPVAGMARVLNRPPGPGVRAAGFKLMYQQATRAELDPGYWSPGPSPVIADAIATIEASIRPDRSRRLANLEAIWHVLRDDTAVRVIHLRRPDHLAAYVSFVRAISEARWIDTPYRATSIHVSIDGYRRWASEGDRLARYHADMFSGHRVLEVDFTQLTTRFAASVGAMLEILGVEPMQLPAATRRQSRQPLDVVVENYDEVRRAVRQPR
jgi:LPS sulfotransferase NodH